MAFRLVLTQPPANDRKDVRDKDVGDNIFLADLPSDYKVYALYYPGAMPDVALETKLRDLGNVTGKNLLVNIGKLNDPQYDRVVAYFGVTEYPVIVVTAIASLASPLEDYVTTYARLDSQHLLNSSDRTVECVQKLFNLFIQGEVAKAVSKAKWSQRKEVLLSLTHLFANALKSVAGFIADRDISVSVLEGKFELKRSGD